MSEDKYYNKYLKYKKKYLELKEQLAGGITLKKGFYVYFVNDQVKSKLEELKKYKKMPNNKEIRKLFHNNAYVIRHGDLFKNLEPVFDKSMGGTSTVPKIAIENFDTYLKKFKTALCPTLDIGLDSDDRFKKDVVFHKEAMKYVINQSLNGRTTKYLDTVTIEFNRITGNKIILDVNKN
jgi:hypothetical protein